MLDEILWITAYQAGRVAQAWGYDPGLVFYHGGIPEGDESTALYYVLMSCLGHGTGIDDRYPDAMDRASDILNRLSGGSIAETPFYDEMADLMDLVYQAIQLELSGAEQDRYEWEHNHGERPGEYLAVGVEEIEGA
jgi:hypothetical protein